MKKVIKSRNIPANSTIANGFGTIDYCDIFSIVKASNKSAEEISKELLRLPRWANALFFIRNRIVGLFGLKTDKNMRKQDTFFEPIENRKEERTIGQDDKHLNFKVSILKDESKGTISLTTIVHFNNLWGRIYFFPVKPFHQVIMKALLKRYLKNK